MQTIVRSLAPLLAGTSGYKSVKSVSSVVYLGVTGVQEFRSSGVQTIVRSLLTFLQELVVINLLNLSNLWFALGA